jgi:hypothetical protein
LPPLYFRRYSFSDSLKYIFYRIFIPSGKPYQRPHFCLSQFYISEYFIEFGNPPGFTLVKIFVHILAVVSYSPSFSRPQQRKVYIFCNLADTKPANSIYSALLRCCLIPA